MIATAISIIPTDRLLGDEPTVGYDIRGVLQAVLSESSIAGLDSVRLLPSEKRYQHAHDKVFFVLATHDIKRDEQIVRLMMQFERVDYDLVPMASVGMVPGAATKVV